MKTWRPEASTRAPALTACLKALRKGDRLLVWKLDRLGRNLRHLINTVHDLTARGVGFQVLTGHGASINTATPEGKLVFGIFAALAEFERELVSERTKVGLASAGCSRRLRQPEQRAWGESVDSLTAVSRMKRWQNVQ